MPRGAGGTPGGFVEFFVGVAMVIVGGYLFFQRLIVLGSYQVLWGSTGSGLALLILLAGIGVLFFRGGSRVGWLLVVLGIAGIVLSTLLNLVVYFRPGGFFDTLVMFVLILGGLAFVVRSLRPHGSGA